jgi:hypothetical protein
MVEKWAICYENVCANICMWDGLVASRENPTAWQPPEGALMINIENMACDIGWLWDGEKFIDPNPQVDTANEEEIVSV